MGSCKKKLFISISALFVVILLIGGTYAWLNITRYGTKQSEMTAGSLALVLDDEESEGINLERAIPTSDKKGKEHKGYTFSVVNQGTIPTRYKIYLDDLELEANETRMPDKAVKYQLLRNKEDEGWNTLKEGWITDLGSNPNRLLDSVDEIGGGKTNVYTLKVWMDIDAGNEAQDTVFHAKIRIEAEQSNMEVKTSELDVEPDTENPRIPLEEGEDPTKYKWSSSDWEVVKVDEEGNLEPIGPGYAVITKQNIKTGEKEEITVHITIPVNVTYDETSDNLISVGTERETSCDLTENKQTTCQVKVPSVEVKDGYEFIGWSTDKNSHEGEKESVDVSRDKNVLYPIVRKPGVTHQVTLIKEGEGIESIGEDSPTCKAEAVYNDEVSTSCKFTLPEIKVEDGYTVIGWSTNPDDEEGITPGSEVEISGPTTFYPIIKKDSAIITATFKLNGAAFLDGRSSDITKSCEVHTNSLGEALDKCEVNVPVIAASTATPDVIGFNESKTAIIAQISPETRTITITKDVTYYAITKKDAVDYTVTFNRNGAKSLGGEDSESVNVSCHIDATYNGKAQAKSCSITSPSIEASENTPRVIGYSTEQNPENHSSSWNSSIAKQISSNAVYYAQTANDDSITYKANFQVGTNVTSVGETSATCSIAPTYNGVARATSCSVTAPTITPKVGYTSLGYSETKDDTTGKTDLVLTKKETTFYANAVANSYTVEYYSEGVKVNESGVKVGETITLLTKDDLNAAGVDKKGYSFKGWSVTSNSEEVNYEGGKEVSNLSTTEGEIKKLYAVWIDDIDPVCTFSELADSYTVGDIFDVTLTCTDEGSGFDESQVSRIENNSLEGSMPQLGYFSMSLHMQTLNGKRHDFNLVKPLSVKCTLQNTNTITCDYELKANGTDYYHDEEGKEHNASSTTFGVFMTWGVRDLSGNGNEYVNSPETTIYGKTFTATPTTTTGVESIGSTAESCTTELENRTCDVTLGTDVTVKDGYRWAGWSSEDSTVEAKNNYTFTLTGDATFHPVVGPIFVDAYVYNQDKAVGEQGRCITGEESTCEETTCYQDGSSESCATGTVFKYAVKSTYDNHRVDSLNDHVRYFYAIEDKGTTITMQSRENIIQSKWADDIEGGPVDAITNLENATGDWSYVDTQTYEMGTTVFGNTNANTNCSSGNLTCSDSKYYTWEEKNVKARMITTQEAKNVGCTNKSGGCPIWMFNYLVGSIGDGGTNNVSGAYDSYYTMNTSTGASPPTYPYVILLYRSWIVHNSSKVSRGVRAVIELDKTRLANWKS